MEFDPSSAVRILKAGGLVAFPTETVYGLGADATRASAVEKIFVAKGRPSTNPLIVHVADESTARRYASMWPDVASQLAARFWPGPLTLVLPRATTIVPGVSAGRETVGLRVPSHPIAMRLLHAFDGPIAAPSANRSNHVSPTTANHVREELGSTVDLILDGGPCQVGIESTVLDLTTPRPTLLRPGFVTRADLEFEIGPIDLFNGSVSASSPAASPGQHEVHYAPRAPAYRFTRHDVDQVSGRLGKKELMRCRLILLDSTHAPWLDELVPQVIRRLPGDVDAYARRLYAVLREADQAGIQAIFVEMPPDEPQWAAVRDRLRRATRVFQAESRE